jgi:hypothetical protein
MEQYRCLVTIDQTLGQALQATWAATFASEKDYRFGVSHIAMEVLFRDFENESFYCRGCKARLTGETLETDISSRRQGSALQKPCGSKRAFFGVSRPEIRYPAPGVL